MSGDAKSVKEKLVDFYTNVVSGEELLVYETDSAQSHPVPTYIQKLIDNIHPEVVRRFLGAGFPQGAVLESLRVLDLGCGHGRDVFLYSQLVGPSGHVIGIDITPSTVKFVEGNIDYHMKKFGYTKSNVKMMTADAEDLSDIPDCSIDVVMTNGITCTVPDKNKMLKEIFRILKTGGEFSHLDGYCNGGLFDEMRNDDLLWAEGNGGAFYWKDFIDECCSVGFTTPMFVCMEEWKTKSEEVKRRLPQEELFARFCKIQYGVGGHRTFKVEASQSSPACVTYKGGIKYHEDEYQLDFNTVFKAGVAVDVCGEIAAILKQSRFAPYFTFSPPTGGKEIKIVVEDPFEWMTKQSM